MIGIGLIGFGRWGANLARNFVAAGARLVAVSDPRPERLASAMMQYAGLNVSSRWRDLVADPRVDAIVVATPPATHFEIANESLAAGKHTLVEKPLALTSGHARQLRDLARQSALTLMVDHTFVYSDAIEAVRRMSACGDLGDLLYYDGIRIGHAPPDTGVGVLWDLAVHDIAVMMNIVGQTPVAVAAQGFARLAGSPVCDAQLTLQFSGSFVGSVHVSWLSSTKVRRTLVGGRNKVILIDELDPTEKVRVCTRDPSAGIQYDADATAPPAGAISAGLARSPDRRETLGAVAREFIACVRSGREPLANGEAGVRTVEVLEVAQMSLQLGGPLMHLPVSGPAARSYHPSPNLTAKSPSPP